MHNRKESHFITAALCNSTDCGLLFIKYSIYKRKVIVRLRNHLSLFTFIITHTPGHNKTVFLIRVVLDYFE